MLLLALEGVALLVLGIGYGVAGLSESGDHAPVGYAVGAAVGTGLLLLLLAWATDTGRSWARGPAVTLNLFPLPVAVYGFQAGAWWAAIPLVLLAGSVLYLCAHPGLRSPSRERG